MTEQRGRDDGSRQETPFDEIEKVTEPAPGRAEPRKLSNEDAGENDPGANPASGTADPK